MTHFSSPRVRGRLLSVAALSLLICAVWAPASVAAADYTIPQAEMAMLNALNADRVAVGLVPVQMDSRLMAIARGRSVDMATKHYFSHTQPDGQKVFSILTANAVKWYSAGEIIAWNNASTLTASTVGANNQWLNSPGHKAIVVSTTFNYVGVGLAIDATNGHRIWTAVYIKGPDRTGAVATARTPLVANSSTVGMRRVTLNWSGADVPLQVLTSGLDSFTVQRRADGGTWATVLSGTTALALTQDLATGHAYEFRVAARDKAGNTGAWSTVGTTLVGTITRRIVAHP
jgi:uncharacterized protein YkwD